MAVCFEEFVNRVKPNEDPMTMTFLKENFYRIEKSYTVEKIIDSPFAKEATYAKDGFYIMEDYEDKLKVWLIVPSRRHIEFVWKMKKYSDHDFLEKENTLAKVKHSLIANYYTVNGIYA